MATVPVTPEDPQQSQADDLGLNNSHMIMAAAMLHQKQQASLMAEDKKKAKKK